MALRSIKKTNNNHWLPFFLHGNNSVTFVVFPTGEKRREGHVSRENVSVFNFNCIQQYTICILMCLCGCVFVLLCLCLRTALARFRQAQLEEGKVKVRSTSFFSWYCGFLTDWWQTVCPQERRPFLASECSELPKAEKWRRQVCVLLLYDWLPVCLAGWLAAWLQVHPGYKAYWFSACHCRSSARSQRRWLRFKTVSSFASLELNLQGPDRAQAVGWLVSHPTQSDQTRLIQNKENSRCFPYFVDILYILRLFLNIGFILQSVYASFC